MVMLHAKPDVGLSPRSGAASMCQPPTGSTMTGRDTPSPARPNVSMPNANASSWPRMAAGAAAGGAAAVSGQSVGPGGATGGSTSFDGAAESGTALHGPSNVEKNHGSPAARCTQADELDGDVELVLDGERDATLGRAVELGEHDAGDVDGVGELPGLHETVLTRRRVDDEQDLGDATGRSFGDAADLAELLHEVGLGVETSSGVGQHDVDVAGVRPLDGVEHDSSGIATLGPAHQWRPHPVSPQV